MPDLGLTEDRVPWKFDRSTDENMRGVRALEFVAHYLDRIELQLDRLNASLEYLSINTEMIPALAELSAIRDSKPRG